MKHAFLGQRLHDLLDEERVAAGSLADQLSEPVQRWIAAEQLAQQLAAGLEAEGREHESAVLEVAHPVGAVLGPECHQQQRVRAGDRLDHAFQEGLRAGVKPVQVLDQDHFGPLQALHLLQALDRTEQAALARLRAHRRRRALRPGHAEEIEDQRQRVGERGVEHQQAPRHLLARRVLVVGVGDAELRPHQLQGGGERNRARVRERVGVVHRDAFGTQPLEELQAQAALADARLGREPDHLSVARRGTGPGAIELGHLLAASHQAREPARHGHFHARAHGADAAQRVHLQRRGDTFDVELAQIGEVEVALDEGGGGRGQVRAARLSERLHALGEPHRVADRRIGDRALVAQRAHDHLARVQPHAHAEAQAARFAQLRRVAVELVAQMKHRVAGARSVVLVRDRRPEDRHDAVACEPVDGSLKASHARREDLQEAVHDRAPLLRVERAREIHRPLHVGEQDRDLLAFAREL